MFGLQNTTQNVMRMTSTMTTMIIMGTTSSEQVTG